MRSTTLLTSALLALALSPAAWGDDRRDRRDRHDRYDRYDRHGQYPGHDQGRVESLARQLERTASYVHHEFERNNRRPDRDEARVASVLHELNRQAAQLYSRVGSYRGSSRQGEREFRDVLNAYYRAADTLRYVRPRGYVDRGMDQIGGLISELSRYYGRYDEYSRWDDRYRRDRGRYGHDRYGRDRDRYDDHGDWDDDWDGRRRRP